MTITAATPVQQTSAYAPPPTAGTVLPPTRTVYGSGGESPRLRIANWMENHLGKLALPVAMAAGGLVGGGVGSLLLGPIGLVGGAIGGAMLGGALFMAG